MSTPIQSLNPDLIIHIFDLLIQRDTNPRVYLPKIETIKPHSALLAALRATQICQQWRHIIVETPFIWAKVVNLDLLHTSKFIRRKVMSRTKNALLFVQGHQSFVLNTQTVQNTLLWPFIQTYWKRIRSLDVAVDEQKMSYRFFKVARLSSELENFSVFSSQDEIMPDRTNLLFPNEVQFLRRLNCGPYVVDLASPWLRQLREFQLHNFKNRSASLAIYPRKRFYAALAQMPNLQFLSIECAIFDYSALSSHRPNSIYMPQLCRLEVKGEATQCLDVLTILDFPRTCAPLILISAKTMGTPDNAFPLVARQISSLLLSLFPPIPTLAIKIGLSQISILTETRTNFFFSGTTQHDGMMIQGGWKPLPYSIFQSIGLIEFATQVTSLDFDIVQGAVPEAIVAQPTGQESLDEFLKGLVNLIDLTCSTFSVDYLIRIRLPILPKLRSLTIKGAPGTRGLSMHSAENDFRMWRSGQGLPPVETVKLKQTVYQFRPCEGVNWSESLKPWASSK